ncbi:hypothetical protein [Brevibacillus brevis]|uniref:Uncharacterized protein n=1 Tax=Brevibacillus brevis TaxID=1393 RepID=A0ABY9TBL4_BREBE|nr:hypothetical protein [Brevibacillus brevis]WNC17498.1 hypothetical protein RGB73_14690 [Brevibacillus brevis]
MSSCKDDDVAVIALWIIAIGVIILAIDKTTRLNNQSDSKQMAPPTCAPCHSSEDQQWDQIQKQLAQLKDGLSQLKKICKSED